MEELRITTGNELAATFNANPYRGEKARWLTALDFFPDHKRDEELAEQELDKQISYITAIMGCGPGKVGRA